LNAYQPIATYNALTNGYSSDTIACNANDIVTGYCSEQGFKAYKTSGKSKCRDLKGKTMEISNELLDLLRNPAEVCDDELAILGFERRLVQIGASMEMEKNNEGKVIVHDKYTGLSLIELSNDAAMIAKAVVCASLMLLAYSLIFHLIIKGKL
jgi:hypothetical protein